MAAGTVAPLVCLVGTPEDISRALLAWGLQPWRPPVVGPAPLAPVAPAPTQLPSRTAAGQASPPTPPLDVDPSPVSPSTPVGLTNGVSRHACCVLGNEVLKTPEGDPPATPETRRRARSQELVMDRVRMIEAMLPTVPVFPIAWDKPVDLAACEGQVSNTEVVGHAARFAGSISPDARGPQEPSDVDGEPADETLTDGGSLGALEELGTMATGTLPQPEEGSGVGPSDGGRGDDGVLRARLAGNRPVAQAVADMGLLVPSGSPLPHL